MKNSINRSLIAALPLSCLGVTMLAAQNPAFTVDPQKGTYSFENGVVSLKDIKLEVGNIPLVPRTWDILKGAEPQPGSTEKHPRKWVRREGDRVYLAAINVEDKPITVTIQNIGPTPSVSIAGENQ